MSHLKKQFCAAEVNWRISIVNMIGQCLFRLFQKGSRDLKFTATWACKLLVTWFSWRVETDQLGGTHSHGIEKTSNDFSKIWPIAGVSGNLIPRRRSTLASLIFFAKCFFLSQAPHRRHRESIRTTCDGFPFFPFLRILSSFFFAKIPFIISKEVVDMYVALRKISLRIIFLSFN